MCMEAGQPLKNERELLGKLGPPRDAATALARSWKVDSDVLKLVHDDSMAKISRSERSLSSAAM